MRFVWTSDVHAKLLNDSAAFWKQMPKTDRLIISGDISDCPSLADEIDVMMTSIPKAVRVYFVLGNHDFYRGSFKEAEEIVEDACRKHKDRLFYLSASRMPVFIEEEAIAIAGANGWCDGNGQSFAEVAHLGVQMNDFNRISELFVMTDAGNHLERKKVDQGIGKIVNQSIRILRAQLNAAIECPSIKHIVIVTHVPPFVESAVNGLCMRYQNHSDTDDVESELLPFYVCKKMGEMIMSKVRVMLRTSKRKDITILSGHVHGESEHSICSDNITVKAYTHPSGYHDPKFKEMNIFP